MKKSENEETKKQKQVVETLLVPRLVTFRAGNPKREQTPFARR